MNISALFLSKNMIELYKIPQFSDLLALYFVELKDPETILCSHDMT